MQPIKEPAITPQGIVFEKQALIKWVQQTGKCPMTRENLTLKDIRKFTLTETKGVKTLSNQGQIIEMLEALVQLGISCALTIEEAEDGW
jgi:hypothetical protein